MRISTKWSAFAIGLAAITALAAGCGGGDDDANNATPAATDYASCLQANGVTLAPGGQDGRGPGRPSGIPSDRPSGRPSGGPGGNGFPSGAPGGPGGFGNQPPAGVDQETWEKAQQECAGLRPSGMPGNRPDNGAQTAYRNCLNDHGVNATGPVEELDTSDPTVAAAMQACAALRPSGNVPTPTAS